ncbi:hypothetical protein ABBQ38_008880 [Trebouxia sp. C0009 RCD-2024]
MQTLPGAAFGRSSTCLYTRSTSNLPAPSSHQTHRPCRHPRSRTKTKAQDGEDSQKSEAQRLLAEAEALMAEIGSGDYKARQAKQSAEAAKQAEAGLATQGLKLRCDVNGCVIVPINAQHSTPGLAGSLSGQSAPKTEAQTAPRPQDFQLSEGKGWKMGFDKRPHNPGSFSALLGGDHWSIALSKYEYDDFVKLLKNLRRSVTTLEICGEWGTGDSANDEAALEVKTDRIWMEGRAQQKRLSALQDFWNHQDNDGNEVQLGAVKSAFEVRFIVSSPGQRDVEGRFDPDTVMRILEHLDAEEGAVKVAASLGAAQSPVTVNA